MSDLISRQAAIDALDDWSEHSMTDAEAWHIKQVIGDIKSLPSAQPQRMRGKWIKADSQQYFRKHYPFFTCSECGQRKDSQKAWNYCPNCGAQMDEEKENTHD